jgi:glycerophosphoryl diester phosphodiesterase
MCFVNLFRCVHNCSKRLFAHLRARGNWTVIWVVNSKVDMQECYDKFGNEVDGLMTDSPIELVDFVNSKSTTNNDRN